MARRGRSSSASCRSRRPAWRGWWAIFCPSPASSSTSIACRPKGCALACGAGERRRQPGHEGRGPQHDHRAAGRSRRACRRSRAMQDELIQLFQNLIDNALKYGRAGSPVRRAGPGQRAARGHDPGRGPAVAVAVLDQGEGIAARASAAAHRALLPGRYRPLARSGGTGLGLAIVKHIVSRHRGALGTRKRVRPGQPLHGLSAAIEPGDRGTRPPMAADCHKLVIKP